MKIEKYLGMNQGQLAAALVALSAVMVHGVSASAQTHPFALEVEGAGFWLGRNDVRIPNNETATEFSLVEAVGEGPYTSFRVSADVNVNDRHGFRFVFAPLRIDEAGILADEVRFAGQTFAAGPIEAQYKFSSYRATYRYRFFNGDRWQWRVGFTGFVRDARIALERGGILAEDTDVGFVPLLHLQGHATLSSRWSLLVDLDGLASTQGRAFDISTKLEYRAAENWHLAVGYRTIEGGADVDDVFNFAWLNFAVASIRYGF